MGRTQGLNSSAGDYGSSKRSYFPILSSKWWRSDGGSNWSLRHCEAERDGHTQIANIQYLVEQPMLEDGASVVQRRAEE
jgi:hypothetical protein